MKPHGAAALSVVVLAVVLTAPWRVGADPLAHTYSIVARDAATGEMGVAVAGADRVYDIRVDDHGEPLQELRRLLRYQRGYNHANRGDELMAEKRVDEALTEYAAASRLVPEVLELPFWHAVALASIGREADAMPLFRLVFAKEPIWAELLSRLPAAGLFPNDQALIQRIRAVAPKPQD